MELGSKWLCEELKKVAIPVSLTDDADMIAVLTCHFASKPHSWPQTLSASLASATLTAARICIKKQAEEFKGKGTPVKKGAKMMDHFTERVVLCPVNGESTSILPRVLPGAVLSLRAAGSEFFHTKNGEQPLTTIAYDISLFESASERVDALESIPTLVEAHPELEGADIVYNRLSSSHTTIREAGKSDMKSLCAACKQRGVRLVVCMKGIHVALKHLFLQEGILFVERVGRPDWSHLIRTLGGSVLSSLSSEDVVACTLGRTDTIGLVPLSGKDRLHVSGSNSGTSTVLVAASHLAWSTALTHSGLRLVQQLLTTPWVVPGGGCSESQIAAGVRSHVEAYRASCPGEFRDFYSYATLYKICLCVFHLLTALSSPHPPPLPDTHSPDTYSLYYNLSFCFHRRMAVQRDPGRERDVQRD